MATNSVLTSEKIEETCKTYNEMITTLPKCEVWPGNSLVLYKGFWMSPYHNGPNFRGLVLAQNHFIAKPTDIMLITSPKSGTIWLRSLVYAIVHRALYDFATHPLLHNHPRDLVPALGLFLSENYPLSYFESLASPRIFATHMPYTMFSESIKASGCRFVYLCRNPKDVLVSLWHFKNKMRSKELMPLSLQELFELFCEGATPFGPFWDHVLCHWNAYKESPGRILFLTYEDLKREPEVHVRKLAEFLGTPFSEQEESRGVVEEVIKLCSFEKLSNLEVNKSLSSKTAAKNPDFFRKGEVGDWKNHLTPEMAARLDQITEEKLKSSGFNFIM